MEVIVQCAIDRYTNIHSWLKKVIKSLYNMDDKRSLGT